MRLSEMALKKYSPKGKREILWDDRDGLGLRIGDIKWTWIVRYTFDGRRALVSIGTYPALSLTEARARAAGTVLDVERGIDPGAVKKEKKQTRKSAPTVAEFIEEFYERKLKGTRSGKERKRLLTFDVLPLLGKKKMIDVKRRDIDLLLDGITDRGAPVVRNRVYSSMHLMFKTALKKGVIKINPCTDFDKEPEKKRERVLLDEEIKLLWNALDINNKAVGIYRVTKLALQMVLVTGQRPGEICGMTWEELDLEKKAWVIPAARMKAKVVHRVPLTILALDVIEQARAYSGDGAYVFSGVHGNDKSLTSGSLPKAMLRHWEKEIGLPEAATPHDMRRTVRTRLAEMGVEDIIAERVLAHKPQGIAAVYNLYAYDKEKRHALELWERKLRQIVGLDVQVGKVIQMREG